MPTQAPASIPTTTTTTTPSQRLTISNGHNNGRHSTNHSTHKSTKHKNHTFSRKRSCDESTPLPTAPSNPRASKPTSTPPAPPIKIIYVQVKYVTKAITIAIGTADKVSALKMKIYKHTNTVVDAQSLSYNGKRLMDDTTIGTYRINDGDSIDLFIRPIRTYTKRKADTLKFSSSSSSSLTSTSSTAATPASSSKSTSKSISKSSLKSTSTSKPTTIPVMIDLISDDEDEEKTKTFNRHPQPQKEVLPQRKVKVRVEDGSISVLNMNYSVETTLLDVISLHENTYGKHEHQQSIIFGGVALQNEFLLDDLFLEDDSILNLCIV